MRVLRRCSAGCSQAHAWHGRDYAVPDDEAHDPCLRRALVRWLRESSGSAGDPDDGHNATALPATISPPSSPLSSSSSSSGASTSAPGKLPRKQQGMRAIHAWHKRRGTATPSDDFDWPYIGNGAVGMTIDAATMHRAFCALSPRRTRAPSIYDPHAVYPPSPSRTAAHC